jgi:hypothetical protein
MCPKYLQAAQRNNQHLVTPCRRYILRRTICPGLFILLVVLGSVVVPHAAEWYHAGLLHCVIYAACFQHL